MVRQTLALRPLVTRKSQSTVWSASVPVRYIVAVAAPGEIAAEAGPAMLTPAADRPAAPSPAAPRVRKLRRCTSTPNLRVLGRAAVNRPPASTYRHSSRTLTDAGRLFDRPHDHRRQGHRPPGHWAHG